MARVVHADEGDVWVQTFGTGHASFSLFSIAPTDKMRRKWAKDDQAREKRRTVPFGFRAAGSK